MLHLFSTKAALRKAMVGLASENPHYDEVSGLMRSIANYLTDGGLSKMDAKIKAQEEIVASLERQSKSLAEVIRAQEEESERLSDGIVKEAVSKLESLVAQVAEHPGPDTTIEEPGVKSIPESQ